MSETIPDVIRAVALDGDDVSAGEGSLRRLLATGFAAKESSEVDDPHDHSVAYEASPARGPSGRSLSRNAIVARLARFGRAAPRSLGELDSAARCNRGERIRLAEQRSGYDEFGLGLARASDSLASRSRDRCFGGQQRELLVT